MSDKFWYVVFIFSFDYKKLLTLFLISVLTQFLLSSELFNS